MDYRKFYGKTFGISWNPLEMEVHHIDLNRENNEIENLILLPKSLHAELHDALMDLRPTNVPFDDVIKRMIRGLLNHGLNWEEAAIRELVIVLEKCRRWGFLKSMHYNDVLGNHISIIDLDTFKWIE